MLIPGYCYCYCYCIDFRPVDLAKSLYLHEPPIGHGGRVSLRKGETDRAIAALEEPVNSPKLLRASKVRKLVWRLYARILVQKGER